MNDHNRWHILTRKKFELQIVDAFEYFRQHRIEPILIKGWVAARLYPPGVHRPFVDIDLAVSSADYESARALLGTEFGSRLGIDLHREFRHHDTKAWKDVYKDSHMVLLNGVGIRVPNAEDHLRMLCVHWLNDGGAYKDRLWDIYYAVQNQPEEFDWDRCLSPVSKIRQQWIVATIGLAHKYLRLEIDHLPFAERAKQLPSWLTSAVEGEWKAGIPLRPLQASLNDWKALTAQIRKRIPPNPVQATIEMEGSFESRSRLYYQLGTMFIRAVPSLKRIFGMIARKRDTN